MLSHLLCMIDSMCRFVAHCGWRLPASGSACWASADGSACLDSLCCEHVATRLTPCLAPEQTEAHPRIAILVKTLRVGMDDIVHFVMLCLLVLGAFVALGVAQFGAYREDFKDLESAFRVLWEMM